MKHFTVPIQCKINKNRHRPDPNPVLISAVQPEQRRSRTQIHWRNETKPEYSTEWTPQGQLT